MDMNVIGAIVVSVVFVCLVVALPAIIPTRSHGDKINTRYYRD